MSGDASSPMMVQYLAIKAQHPDSLLFYRMGDFYELFFADAVQAAAALDIALTRRGQHQGADIPMCGVPVHSHEAYLHRLIERGFRVAIGEQLEDPAEAKRRGGKSVVKRDVVRIVTPGTITEDTLLDARRNNFLAAVARVQNVVAAAWLDLSTGAFFTQATDAGGLGAVLSRIDPGELLVAQSLLDGGDLAPALATVTGQMTPLPAARFDSVSGERRLCDAYGVTTPMAFGAFGRAELAAAGALLDYVHLTQKGGTPRLDPPRRIEAGSLLVIDPSTRRNLELVQGAAGGREGSLLAAIDRTVTGAGGRLLASRLAAPLADVDAIRQRLEAVATALEDGAARTFTRTQLAGVPDLDRALSRLALGRSGPRDLGSIARGLERAVVIRERLAAADPTLGALALGIPPGSAIAERLRVTLADEPPHLARDGGFVRPGVSAELDELRELRDQGRRHIVALEARYRETTGIASLKIRHNGMLGYYVEVTSTHLGKVTAEFIQRQGMSGATRYMTAELAELAARIATAGDRTLALELALFETLRQETLVEGTAIRSTARALAEIDVTTALAELAAERGYVRPVVDDSLAFAIEGGRHPVVEQALARASKPFVANDCDLGETHRLWLLTGPNMAGKSTFLRQNALIAIMAQAGSFVPAASARLGVMDRVFSRVGAADDLARGRSTFMVEMVETAAILHQAGQRSLVILDEIGRGTATFDGLSIAWAVVEHLHETVRARGLFATHYHELTALAARLPALACHTMRVKEWKGDVVFLHEVGPGTADRSYGIHVARIAGLPEPVLRRAATVLKRLEAGETRAVPAQLAEDLPLFAAAAPPAPEPTAPSPALALLRQTNPDELSARAALDLVYQLRDLAGEAGEPS